MANALIKSKIEEELKTVEEVALKSLTEDGRLTFQLAVNTITNGENVDKKTVSQAFAAMRKFIANAPEEWLFQRQIMVSSADLAGDAMQKELARIQEAKDKIVISAGNKGA